MGIFGWDLIGSDVTLQGMVDGTADFSSDDGDWEFNVSPDPAFVHLLTNPDGYTNTNDDGVGLIQCEVKPPDRFNQEDLRSQEAVTKHMGTLCTDSSGQTWVQVIGSWVRDRGHSYNGKEIIPDVNSLPGSPTEGFPNPVTWISSKIIGGAEGDETDWHEGKTEIHPITSILAVHSATPTNKTRTVDFFVFSDGKNLNPVNNEAPFPLPDGDNDNTGAFLLKVRAGTTTIARADELDASLSHLETTFSQNQRYTQLHGTVHVGKASEGRGLYKVTLTVPGWTLLTYLIDRNISPGSGILELMKFLGVRSIRQMFTRLDTGGFKPSS